MVARSIAQLKVTLYIDPVSVMYHEQRFVIGYDDEWFAKEIRVKLCDTVDNRQ